MAVRTQVRLALLIAVPIALPGCALVGWPTVSGCYPCSAAAPERPPEVPVTRFIALGDFGTADGGHSAEVAAALRQFLGATPALTERVFELGDNFYYYGLIGARAHCGDRSVPGAAIREQALGVLQPFEFVRDQDITLTAVPGNHDYACGDRSLANELDIDRWLPPPHQWGTRWELVSGLPRELVLGSGAVQIILLDSERMIDDGSFRQTSAGMVEELLKRGRERYRWRVLAAHHPLRTNGIHNGAWWKGTLARLSSFVLLPSHALAALRVPPFDLLNQEAYSIRYTRYREAVEGAVARSGVPVALFLAGHDHQLQLLKPQAAGQPFVLVSGSAAKCSPVRAEDDTLFAAPKNGFAAITVYAQYLDVDFIGTTGCSARAPCTGAADGQAHALFHYRVVQ